MGDITQGDNLEGRRKITEEIGLIPTQARPVKSVDDAATILADLGGILATARPEDRPLLCHTVLQEILVKEKQVVAIRPKPENYDLLQLSLVRSNGFEPSQPFGH